MKIVKTYTAQIYLGLKDIDNNRSFSITEVYKLCQDFVNENSLCVTVTPTQFIYGSASQGSTKGNEYGAVIGLINYPRFPSDDDEIRDIAIELAKILKSKFCQKRVSIVCSDKTIMLEEHE